MLSFLTFRLDLENRLLTREGKELPLPPKAFDLLVCFAENPGRLLTKDELLAKIWAGTFVEEGNLTKGIWLLRKTLGDEHAQIIQTVPKQGYRLQAEVTAGDHPSLVCTDRRPSIAVLAFEDMSAAQDQEYFCEGLAEEIINRLAQQGGLRVASRTSAFQFRDGSGGAREIGAALGVEYLLEGSVRKAGDRIRVIAQLIHAQGDLHVWSQSFDRNLDDVFAIQDEIAGSIAEMFEFSLERGRGTSLRRPLTSDVEAYRCYLEGRYHWNRRPGDAVHKAIACFERAIERDPKFALAHAGLADAYNTLGAWEAGVLPPRDALAKSKAAATRALAAAPDLPEALTSLGYADLHFDWNCERACRRFEDALQRNPEYAVAHHWHAHALLATGKFDQALAESKLVLQLEPDDLLLQSHLIWHHWMARNGEEGVEAALRLLHREPDFPWFHYFLAGAQLLLDKQVAAVDSYRNAVRLTNGSAVMKAGLGYALALAGDKQEATVIVNELSRVEGLFGYEIGIIYLAAGDRDQAFESFERARRERSGWMVYAHLDPRLDSIRSDPRYPMLTQEST